MFHVLTYNYRFRRRPRRHLSRRVNGDTDPNKQGFRLIAGFRLPYMADDVLIIENLESDGQPRLIYE